MGSLRSICKKTGRTVPKGAELSAEEYHLAMEVWIVNSKGEVLIQERSQDCEILPGIWGLTTGRMVAGEDTRSGCIRELREELGLAVQPEQLQFLRRILRQDGTHLIWDIYLLQMDVPISQLRLQSEEVSGAKWADLAALRQLILTGKLFFYPEIWEIIEYLDSGAYRAEQLNEPKEKRAVATEVLEQLPGWFENEQARGKYAADCENQAVFCARKDGKVAGFLAAKRLSDRAAEIAVMGVAPKIHREGIGRALFWRCAAWCWQNGIGYLQVKTLGEKKPDAGYAKTRAFYQKMGFVPLECFDEIWGEENPCQILVRYFFEDGIAKNETQNKKRAG